MKVDLTDIGADPISGFYKKYEATKNKLIDETVDSFFANIQVQVDIQIKTINEQVEQLEKEIQDRYEKDNIHSRTIQNYLILGGCLIIVGIFCLSIYFSNKKIIDAFNMFQFQKQKRIKQLKSQILHLVYDNFSVIRTEQIVNKVFAQYGLISCAYINENDILTKLNKPNIIGIQKAHLVYYKNTPIYDATFVEVNWHSVKTEGYYTYITTVNGITTTHRAYKYHYEPTPFIESNNKILLFSNFLQPSFSIISKNQIDTLNANYEQLVDQKHYDSLMGNLVDFASNIIKSFTKNKNENESTGKSLPLENDDFNEKIHFKWNGTEKEYLEFFTIKVQEDFIKWSVQYCSLTDQNYEYRNYIFWNGKKFEIPFSYWSTVLRLCMPKTSSKISDTFNVDQIKNKLKVILKKYFDDWFRTVQLPLLVTGINQEWYQPNKEYLIALNNKLTPTFNHQTSLRYLINSQWMGFFTFSIGIPKFYIDKNKTEIAKWIKVIKEEAIDNNRKVLLLELNSFASKILIVKGTEKYDVPVRYEHFYPIKENKIAYVFSTSNWPQDESVRIVMWLADKKLYENTSYYDEELTKLVNNNSLHIFGSNIVAKSSYFQNILKILANFNHQYPEFLKHFLIDVSTEFGGIILCNDSDWLTKHDEISNKIEELSLVLNQKFNS